MNTIGLLLLVVLSLAQAAAKEKGPARYAIPLPPAPDFSAVDWLVGEWSGATLEKSPKAEIHFSAAYDLDNRFMILREEISFAASKTDPAVTESWMGILSPDGTGKAFVLRVYSSTGFVTRYLVTDDDGLRFTPEGGEKPPPEWLFRRVVAPGDEATFVETVQAAPPGKPFFDYYTAKLTRVKPANVPPASAKPASFSPQATPGRPGSETKQPAANPAPHR